MGTFITYDAHSSSSSVTNSARALFWFNLAHRILPYCRLTLTPSQLGSNFFMKAFLSSANLVVSLATRCINVHTHHIFHSPPPITVSESRTLQIYHFHSSMVLQKPIDWVKNLKCTERFRSTSINFHHFPSLFSPPHNGSSSSDSSASDYPHPKFPSFLTPFCAPNKNKWKKDDDSDDGLPPSRNICRRRGLPIMASLQLPATKFQSTTPSPHRRSSSRSKIKCQGPSFPFQLKCGRFTARSSSITHKRAFLIEPDSALKQVCKNVHRTDSQQGHGGLFLLNLLHGGWASLLQFQPSEVSPLLKLGVNTVRFDAVSAPNHTKS